jgi:hypothetical protein
MTSARADIISSSPSLPVLDVPYTSAVGAGCFPAAGFCVSAGSLTLTAPATSDFTTSPGNQLITSDATYSGELTTDPGGAPAGTLNLTGTIAQEVVGRTSDTETGSWVDDITSLSLSGTLEGNPLDLTLDPADLSEDTGSTSITSLSGGQNDGKESLYDISSFFDVFVELSYNNGALTTTRQITGEIGVPEPASLTLLAAPLLALGVARRRRRG